MNMTIYRHFAITIMLLNQPRKVMNADERNPNPMKQKKKLMINMATDYDLSTHDTSTNPYIKDIVAMSKDPRWIAALKKMNAKYKDK